MCLTDVKAGSSAVVIKVHDSEVTVMEGERARPGEVGDMVLGTFKPESPDVTRAAKRFERARRSEEDIKEEEEERVIRCDVIEDARNEAEESRAEQEKRGARSKTSAERWALG